MEVGISPLPATFVPGYSPVSPLPAGDLPTTAVAGTIAEAFPGLFRFCGSTGSTTGRGHIKQQGTGCLRRVDTGHPRQLKVDIILGVRTLWIAS